GFLRGRLAAPIAGLPAGAGQAEPPQYGVDPGAHDRGIRILAAQPGEPLSERLQAHSHRKLGTYRAEAVGPLSGRPLTGRRLTGRRLTGRRITGRRISGRRITGRSPAEYGHGDPLARRGRAA